MDKSWTNRAKGKTDCKADIVEGYSQVEIDFSYTRSFGCYMSLAIEC